MFRGKPMRTRSTSFSTSNVFNRSRKPANGSARMYSSGWAIVLVSSLTATPMRLVPWSRARMRMELSRPQTTFKNAFQQSRINRRSGGASPQPTGVANQIGHHSGQIHFWNRQVFARGLGKRPAGSIGQDAPGLENAVLTVGHQLAGGEDFIIRSHRVQKPHGQFGAKCELSRWHRAGPDHDFVEYGRQNAAVHDAAKADVRGAQPETRAHGAPVGGKTQFESDGVAFAADEA